MLKVLPNDPDVNDVKKEEEFLFKKDDERITHVDATSIETNEIDSGLPTTSIAKPSNASEPFMEIISSVDANEIDSNQSPPEGAQIMIIERKDLEKTVTNQTPEELNVPFATDDENELRAKEEVTVFSNNEIEMFHDKDYFRNLSNGGVLEGSIFQTFHFDDDKSADDDDSEEDYSSEIVKPRPTEYSSRQRTLPSSTLLHGYIANPGYPSFYIGKNTDCKWKLKLDEGESIALTILDLHLRSK